jgi:hypothetical protein
MGTGEIIAATSGGLAVAGVVLAGLVKVARLVRRVGRFLDEFFGYHSLDRRIPGFSERLTRVEGQLVQVRQQVLPNDGSSLRDAVDSIGRRLDAHLVEAADELRLFRGHIDQHV